MLGENVLLAFVKFSDGTLNNTSKCIKLADRHKIHKMPLPGQKVKIQFLKTVILDGNQRDYIKIL